MNVDGCTQVPPVELRTRRIGHGATKLVGRLDGRAGSNALAVATGGFRPGAYVLELQATDPSEL